MKLTGEMLKQERKRQNLSINEVALATKINAKVLAAIEDGELEKLPPKSFLRGFVRSYAKYLNMDLDRVLGSFQEEMGVTTHVPEDSSQSKTRYRKRAPFLRDSSMTTKTLAVAGILVLIGMIIGIKNIIEKYEREREIGEPPANIVSLSPDDKNENEAEQKETEAEATYKERSAAQDSAKTSDSEAKAEKPSEAPKAEDPVKAEVKVEAPKQATPSSPPPAPAAPTAQNTTPEAAKPAAEPKPAAKPESTDSPQELILEALDKVRVTFQIDGGKTQTIQLQPEQIHIIKAQRMVSVEFNDGGAVNIIHNGRDLGVPGDLGKSKKVKFP